jgi:biotin-(acetyl-CoA carboxylase) ligase
MKLSSDMGKQITVVDQITNKTGIFENIDQAGNLMLRIENNLIKINTGDVFLN